MSINNVNETNFFIANQMQQGIGNALNKAIQDDFINFKNQVDSDNNEETVNSTEAENSDMAVIAHRGYSSVAPENTIPAFVAAAENGFNTVECDVEWTKDNVPVILHDSTINRTARRSNGIGFLFPRKCSNYTYEQLLKYDFGSWKGSEFKGTKIPSFEELLDCANEHDLNLYIELKKTSDFNEEKAKILVDAVKEAGLEDKVTWISFQEDYLKQIDELMPNSRLGYLSDEKLSEETIKILQDLDTEENEVFLDIKASKMTSAGDKLLDDAGFDFEAWTVDKSDTLDDLYDYECKGITTNKLTDEVVAEYIRSLED